MLPSLDRLVSRIKLSQVLDQLTQESPATVSFSFRESQA